MIFHSRLELHVKLAKIWWQTNNLNLLYSEKVIDHVSFKTLFS